MRVTESGPTVLPRSLLAFKILVCGIILLVLVMFATAYPAGLTAIRFFATAAALVVLLLINAFLMTPIRGLSPAMQSVQDWAFLVLSAALVLAVVWLSG